MARMVVCVKLHQELPGLEFAPIGGALGQRIFEQVSARAWEMWQQQATILINHYGLNLADPDARAFLREQMEAFLFEAQADEKPEGWTPEDAGPAAKGKGGAAAPPRKK